MAATDPDEGDARAIEARVKVAVEVESLWSWLSDPEPILANTKGLRSLPPGTRFRTERTVAGWEGYVSVRDIDGDERQVEIEVDGRREREFSRAAGSVGLRVEAAADQSAIVATARLEAIGGEIDTGRIEKELSRILGELKITAEAEAITVDDKAEKSGKRRGQLHFENSFAVAVPIEEVWRSLLDLERVAGYLPGASIKPTAKDEIFEGAMRVKLGPVTAGYSGTVKLEKVDDEDHIAVMRIEAQEQRGQGAANASITNRAVSDGSTTTVFVETDLQITGRQAQFGRGIMESVAGKMLGEFAKRFERDLIEQSDPEDRPLPVASKSDLRSPIVIAAGLLFAAAVSAAALLRWKR